MKPAPLFFLRRFLRRAASLMLRLLIPNANQRCGATGRARRGRSDRVALSARLSAAPVPAADQQPAWRPLRRLACQQAALPARGLRGDPRGVARRRTAWRQGLRDRLGGRRLGPRTNAGLRARTRSLGCDFIDVSSGGLSADQCITVGAGYQQPFAAAEKQAVKMKVIHRGAEGAAVTITYR